MTSDAARQIGQFLSGIPREIVTIFISMLPISELRGAIPWATAMGMSWKAAFFYAYIGNFIPVIPLLLFLDPVSRYLRRWHTWDRFFDWIFARTRRKGKMIERYEFFGLILFVGIPLPVTGAWTGTVAAFLFGIPLWRAVVAAMCGIFLAGCIVTMATQGVVQAFKFFL
jgi:uncharacterized membrane protein